MRFKAIEALTAALAFRTLPTTILVVLVYLILFTTVLITDELVTPPASAHPDLQEAYANLHSIAARPHSYNSHANDRVRSFILSRLHRLASQYPHVRVADDHVSDASWVVGSSHGVYFEGMNILVKVEGTDPQYHTRGGVLFSAHYDSVSTAPGVSDDGMGIAVLIDLVKFFATRRTRRTAVFNINNGEEDGLHGAHLYFSHPWSNITEKFLNLEGAAAGGRPILFRATSTSAVRSFQGKGVRHPHGNVLAADAFARGVIRSGTDYSVYTQGGATGLGMDGLDLAFYKGRSKYHTKYDSIPGTQGGKKALWAMMETARGVGVSLLNDLGSGDWREMGDAVYFDLFGRTMVVFPLRTLLAYNIALTVCGPIIIVLVLVIQSLLVYKRSHPQNGDAQGTTWLESFRQWFTNLNWLKVAWKWSKFWVCLAISIGLQLLLVLGYVKFNPLIVYSHPLVVLASTFTLAYVSLVLTLRIPSGTHGPQLAGKQKRTVLLQTYILTWLLLLASTIAVGKLRIGSVYFISAWNSVALLATVIGCIQVMLKVSRAEGERPVRFRSVDEIEGVETRHREVAADEDEIIPTERTPLIPQRLSSQPAVPGEDERSIGWWILQLLVAVPIPLILLLHITLLLLNATCQSLADGSSATFVYGATSFLSILLVLPAAPFTFKLHRYLMYFAAIVFIAATTFSWLSFPFSQDAPFKVFFQQRLALDWNSSAVLNATTSVTGLKKYVEHAIVPHFPSTWKTNVTCGAVGGSRRPELWTCKWQSGLIPEPGFRWFASQNGTTTEDWGNTVLGERLRVRTERRGRNAAQIRLSGANTRACRIYFDSARVTKFHVVGASEGGMQPGYAMPPNGIPELRLWSRTWGRTFVVDVEWDGEAKKTLTVSSIDDGESSGEEPEPEPEPVGLSGRVACEWAEYESGRVGDESEGGGSIPALEEVLAYLPLWAVVTKADDGLVEAWQEFKV